MEAGQKIAVFQIIVNYFLVCQNKFFQRFFYHNTIPVGFYWILTYIWSISLCKIAQLQESEMRQTGWTLSYPKLMRTYPKLPRTNGKLAPKFGLGAPKFRVGWHNFSVH